MQGVNYKAKTKKEKKKKKNLQREYNERLTKGKEEIEWGRKQKKHNEILVCCCLHMWTKRNSNGGKVELKSIVG